MHGHLALNEVKLILFFKRKVTNARNAVAREQFLQGCGIKFDFAGGRFEAKLFAIGVVTVRRDSAGVTRRKLTNGFWFA
ncbi:Uncharacterised protein [Salmonella enterica subsp. enterica serovar Bovismorbificans]|uniref:Uncharacterized protein n=1 Tax=Salmonella enterica subsp. enterica serovar Bovismorbificans TaxID=58097 RepID=A0A655D211_SALET|nr:Uncharacterised protein [Salmonella enterica subsp. enterica serovar Bovismorbificans]